MRDRISNTRFPFLRLLQYTVSTVFSPQFFSLGQKSPAKQAKKYTALNLEKWFDVYLQGRYREVGPQGIQSLGKKKKTKSQSPMPLAPLWPPSSASAATVWQNETLQPSILVHFSALLPPPPACVKAACSFPTPLPYHQKRGGTFGRGSSDSK